MPRRARSPFHVRRRRGSPFFFAEFSVAGERQRVSTGETDRGRAEERAASLWQEAKARAGDPAPPGAVRRTIASLGGGLVAECEQLGRADSYARDLKIDLRLHIVPRWTYPEQITTASWEHATHDLHASGLSWASVKRVGKHIRLLLRYACRVGALQNVPEIKSPAAELVRAEEAERAPLTAAERDALLADMANRKNLRAHRCYTVMFFNLFRKSTVERLTLRWVNFQANTITVPAGKAKNRRPRVYHMHPRTMQALKEQVAAMKKIDPSKPLFGKFDHSNVFWGACIRLGLVGFQPARLDTKGRILVPPRVTDKRGLTPHHVARHTAATLLVDRGVTLAERMAAGGWESVEAAQRYDHEDQVARSKRAIERL